MAFYDLAEIHYRYGATYDALQMWSRSNDACVSKEDYFKCSKKIAVCSFESLNSGFLSKFTSNAANFDELKSTAQTTMIGILDALGRIMQGELYRAAKMLASIDQILAYQSSEVGNMIQPEEIACYFVLMCLATMTRKELKQDVLTSSSVLQLLELQPETADILENYLNGKFKKFQN